MEGCGCGYGFCGECGEEWNLDEQPDCPNSTEALGLEEGDEDFETACDGEWVTWMEDALS